MGSTKQVRYTIYCHTHIDSKRCYVGLTKKTMMQRWNNHVLNAKKKSGRGCTHFWNAIRKHGKDAFSHEVLEVCTDLDQANLAEEWWIRKLGSRNPESGFNLKKGGAHTPHPIKNPWDRPGYREKHKDDILSCLTLEAKAKSKAAAGTFEGRAKRSSMSKARWKNSEFREKCCAASKQTWSDLERRSKMSLTQSEIWENSDVRERASRAIKKKWQDDEYRAVVSSASKESNNRPSVKEKLRQARVGKKASDETKAKLSNTVKLRWQDPAYRDRMDEVLKEKLNNPEHIARKSESAKKVWSDPEYRKRQSEAHRGKSPGQSTRDKLRLANGKFEMEGGEIIAKLCDRHGRVLPGDFSVRKFDGGKISVICLLCFREMNKLRLTT
jgi:group I intron endonuclease